MSPDASLRRRRLRRRFALGCLAAFALPGLPLLAEAALRLHLAWRRSASPLWVERVANPRERVEKQLAPKGVWEEGQTWHRYKANAALEDEALGISFHTNSWGFRGAEFSQVPSAGVHRIVVLGGSTTVGGPHDLGTWPAVLERALNAEPLAPPWTRVEVLNLAVSGADIERSHQRVVEEVEQFRPHALLVYEGVNSIRGRRPYTRWPEWLQAFELHDLLLGRGRDAEVLLATYGWQLQHLKGIGDWCRERGVPLYVGTFAIPERKDFSPEEWEFIDLYARHYYIGRGIDHYIWSLRVWNDFLRVWSRDRRGAPFVLLDLEPELKGPFFLDPCHLDGAGLEKQGLLTARLLRPHLERAGVLAVGR